MPIYMVQASYTSAAWNKLVQRPENRMEANGPGPTRQGITAQGMRRGYQVSADGTAELHVVHLGDKAVKHVVAVKAGRSCPPCSRLEAPDRLRTAHPNDSPKQRAIALRLVCSVLGWWFPEASQDDDSIVACCMANRSEEPLTVGTLSTIEDVRQRKTVEELCRAGFEQLRRIAKDESNVRRFRHELIAALAQKKGPHVGTSRIGVPREASLQPFPEHRTESGGKDGHKWCRVRDAQDHARHQGVERETETARIEMLAPKGELFGRILKGKERVHHAGLPAHQWHEGTRKIQQPFGVAGLSRQAPGATLGVGKLGRIDVACDDFVLIGEPKRGRAGGCDAKQPAFTFERGSLDLRIFVHASEQQSAGGAEPAEPSHRPRRVRRHGRPPTLAP